MTKKAAEKKEQKETKMAVTEKIQKASETVTGKIKTLNDKYLADTVEKGKKTVQEYNEKYVSANFEKGKKTLKEYNEKYISPNVEKGKEYLEKPYKRISKTVDGVLERGRDMEKDALKKLEGTMTRGRELMYKLPLVETVEKGVTKRLNALPALVNMPSKGEIEQLTLAMQTLSSNIETLKHQKVAQKSA